LPCWGRISSPPPLNSLPLKVSQARNRHARQPCRALLRARAPEPIPADDNANLSPTPALFDAITRAIWRRHVMQSIAGLI
jgi:hypothetical protein